MSSIPSAVTVVKSLSTIDQKTARVYGSINFSAGVYETGGLPVSFGNVFPSNNLFRITFHSGTGSGVTYTYNPNLSVAGTGTVLIGGATNGASLSSTVLDDDVLFEAIFIR
jgi:hypothetical protein